MKINRSIGILAIATLVSLVLPASVFSQIRRMGAPIRIDIGGFEAAGKFITVASDNEDDDSEEVSGAVLRTDPDLEALLDRANRHAEDGNFRVATQLWQAVLERSGDSLYSDDEVRYYSISDRVERILAQLPGDALDIYRVKADASAKQILNEANGPNDVSALMRVFGNYFVSSVGDDAAFRLGCLHLDRHDFSGALRVFRKIATQHPDPSVSLDEVYARIAICHAFMGNADFALNSIKVGRDLGTDSAAIDAVERSLAGLTPSEKRDVVLKTWSTSHGNAKRLAAMPALPESAFTVDQVAQWQFYVLPRGDRFRSRIETIGKILVGPESYKDSAASTRNTIEKTMIREWANEGLRPAGHLLFNEDQIIFKAPADVLAFDRSKVSDLIALANGTEPKETAGDLNAKAKNYQPSSILSWRSVWRNVFEVDPATSVAHKLANLRYRNTRSQLSKTGVTAKLGLFPKAMHFGDLIHQQMSMHDGVVYTIEGKSFNDHSRHPVSRQTNHGWNVNFRRTRSNFLTAYESETGRMLWRLPRVNEIGSPTHDPTIKPADDIADLDLWLGGGGMMAAPVKFANLLVVPVNQNGAIHLYGIDPANEGKTVWSSFLCDEPETGSVATAPINLTIDGSDLFATCGTGVLFVVDPTTGKIRFARRYARNGQPNPTHRRNSWNNTAYTTFDGWSSDVIIPNGRELICFCSDTNSIVAIDRNDGSLVWKTGLRPYGTKVDHIIGAWGDLLYLGGKQTIIAINLKSQGYIAWGGEALFDGAKTTARGMVTPQGVFVPAGNAIWQFALQPKKGRAEVLNQVEAFLGTGAPVGNLYSDGERIWVHGASRLYALSPKEE